MIPVILFGKNYGNDNIYYSICDAIGSYGGCSLVKNHISFCDKNISENFVKENPRFSVCDFSSELLSTKNFNGIIIIKENLSLCPRLDLVKSGSATVIISEKDTKYAKYLQSTECRIISCGIASHNTINLSGMSKYRAFISLQREITTIDGRILEPFDFAVRFNFPISVYGLLSSCAVLLLSGIDASKGYFFKRDF